MTLALKNYQQRSLDTLERFLERCRLDGPAAAFAASADSGLLTTYKPLPGSPNVPYVCLRIPTGGGKTVMGAHIIQTAARAYLERDRPLVLWLVPTTQIKTQTLEAFRNPRHPYRMELDDAFDRKVEIFDIADIDQIKPDDLATKVCLVVSTIATARVGNTELRDIYAHKEALEPHFRGAVLDLPNLKRTEDGSKVAYSFANLLMLHGPLIITDEAHNATTPLSFEVYTRFSPRTVVELTATPDRSSSNILVSVGAFELKTENMIKLPVVLKEHNEAWPTAVSAAVARRRSLATLATAEPDYVRPLLLVQAENARGTATVEEVKQHLIDVDMVAPNAIAIATGDQRELDGVDLFDPACFIEVIITKQALKEGWDCSFAYVFCSVAQVKSSTDVQQLLGRVLRMPYAKRRKQEPLNKAYAHVVSTAFGDAASELTKALGNVGFNPLEALQSVRRDDAQPGLALAGGAVVTTPVLPTVVVTVAAAPDLSSAPARDLQNVAFVPHDDGSAGGTLTITDGVDATTVDSILTVVARAQRDTVKSTLEDHQNIIQALRAPSERREVFTVPYLCIREQGELELVEGGTGEDGVWDPLLHPADLSSFAFHEDSMTFEVNVDQRRVSYHYVKDDAATYLPGFALEHTVTDLIGWLAGKTHSRFVKPPVLVEWIRRAVDGLMTVRGFSLAQLVRGQHVLRRKLQEQLESGRRAAMESSFQRMLFAPEADIVSSPDAAQVFAFPPDLAQYPARSYYSGPYRFAKHYYPVPGDLRWQTDAGNETEEFQCARAIDTLDEVKFWTRNLVHRNQFWLPVAHQRTYPDFVALLNDGRVFVIEYKGGDRFSNDDSRAKDAVGKLWAAKSGGRAIYLMAQNTDAQGRNIREQLLAAIAGRT